MNEAETGRFLAMAAGLDPKMPQPDDAGFVRKLWAGHLDDVPFDAAERALRDYYRSERYLTKREPISPADVVQWWNARRRPTDRERAGTNTPRALPRPGFEPQRIHDGVDAALAAMASGRAERRGVDPVHAADEAEGETAYRRMVLANECPHCHAAPGRPCMRLGRNEETRVQLRRYHPSRIDAAHVEATS